MCLRGNQQPTHTLARNVSAPAKSLYADAAMLPSATIQRRSKQHTRAGSIPLFACPQPGCSAGERRPCRANSPQRPRVGSKGDGAVGSTRRCIGSAHAEEKGSHAFDRSDSCSSVWDVELWRWWGSGGSTKSLCLREWLAPILQFTLVRRCCHSVVPLLFSGAI